MKTDYPGWRIIGRSGPARTTIVVGEEAGGVREDISFSLEAPDGSMRLLAWYARSGEVETVASRQWVGLDEMYTAQSWESSKAAGLYAQFKEDFPDEALLGAYASDSPSHSGLQAWHVGFYKEAVSGPSVSWVRGDHLYEYSDSKGTWRLLKADSGSHNAWNDIGAVRR